MYAQLAATLSLSIVTFFSPFELFAAFLRFDAGFSHPTRYFAFMPRYFSSA